MEQIEQRLRDTLAKLSALRNASELIQEEIDELIIGREEFIRQLGLTDEQIAAAHSLLPTAFSDLDETEPF